MTLRAFLAPHVAALREKYLVTVVANLSNGEARPVGPEDDLSSLHQQPDDLHLPYEIELDSLLKAQAHER